MENEENVAEQSHCIWCGIKTSRSEPPEHIVPEAIGCPQDFVLQNGEVCASCNHGLAHLDQALVSDLEIYAFMAGVPRKRGRSPFVSSYGNVHAEMQDGRAAFYFNMDQASIETDAGKKLPGFRGKERDIRATFEQEGAAAAVNFSIEFGRSPKVARALVKIGVEYLCWAKGRLFSANIIAGDIASFVLNGEGYRPVIIGGGDRSKYQHHFGIIAKEGGGLFCCYRLAHFEVLVDLSPDLVAFKEIAKRLYDSYGLVGWTTLPVDAVSVRDGLLNLRS